MDHPTVLSNMDWPNGITVGLWSVAAPPLTGCRGRNLLLRMKLLAKVFAVFCGKCR